MKVEFIVKLISVMMYLTNMKANISFSVNPQVLAFDLTPGYMTFPEVRVLSSWAPPYNIYICGHFESFWSEVVVGSCRVWRARDGRGGPPTHGGCDGQSRPPMSRGRCGSVLYASSSKKHTAPPEI